MGDPGSGKPIGGQVLFAGAWRASQNAYYPFELDTPSGPITYRGKLFNVDWFLRARADIPGGLDATAEEEFLLIPGEVPGEVSVGKLDEMPPARRRVVQHLAGGGSYATFIGETLGVIILLVGLSCLTVAVLNILHRFARIALPQIVPQVHPASLFWLTLFGVMGTYVGWRYFFAGLQRVIARAKLGPVDVPLSSPTLCRGENITCMVRFKPRVAVEITEGTASLTANESVSDSGDRYRSSSTTEETVHEQNIALSPGGTVAAGESVTLQASLPVPADAPPTFWAMNNKLLWVLHVELKLRGWPDWARHIPITVRP